MSQALEKQNAELVSIRKEHEAQTAALRQELAAVQKQLRIQEELALAAKIKLDNFQKKSLATCKDEEAAIIQVCPPPRYFKSLKLCLLDPI